MITKEKITENFHATDELSKKLEENYRTEQ